MKLNTNALATLLLASFIWAFVAIQGCETTHVVHIHNGKPVTGTTTTTVTTETTGTVQVTIVEDESELPIDIIMILDRSGSMERLSEQVIISFNDFIEEQKTIEGEATVSLVAI